MTDMAPLIRQLAKEDLVRYTNHAIDRIRQYGLTTMQVNEMLKNCNHKQSLDDKNGFRVEGRAPASDSTGMRKISAHVCLAEKILVITVINN